MSKINEKAPEGNTMIYQKYYMISKTTVHFNQIDK